MTAVADPLRDYLVASALVLAESRHDALRAAELRHERKVDRARAALASAEGNVVVCNNVRGRAHRAVGVAMLAAHDADRDCAKARLAAQQASTALRAVEAEEVELPAECP